MLLNRWLSLVLLFVICGCGKTVPIEEHNKLLKEYKDEQNAHAETRQKLTTEEGEHAKTQRKLTTEEVRHTETRQKLTTEEGEHAKTQRKLTTEEVRHTETRQKLAIEEITHANTQQKLDLVRDTFTQTERKYKELLEILEPTVPDYFELGRVSLEFGVLKEDAGKTKEALSLYHQARKALQTVIKANESADPHYYLARAYYRLARHSQAEFEDACAHAKKAINLAQGRKHAEAEELKKKIENCK